MTALVKPIERRTLGPYRHYRRRIVVKLYADTISLRLERTRTAYEVPIATLMDCLCRWEAQRIQRERKAARKARIGKIEAWALARKAKGGRP